MILPARIVSSKRDKEFSAVNPPRLFPRKYSLLGLFLFPFFTLVRVVRISGAFPLSSTKNSLDSILITTCEGE